MERRRTNLREIAQKIGISASTVSRALRDLPGIHPETRQQVFRVAQELGYRGGELPVSTKFRNILTLSQGTGTTGDLDYLAGLSKTAVMLNMSLVSHHYGPHDCKNVLQHEFQPRALAAGHVDGIILMHRWPLEIVAALRERFPLVSIIHDYPGTDVDVIALDDRLGMDLLVGHLVQTRCTRIGFYGLCAEMSWSRSRFAGWIDAMIQHGIGFQQSDVVNVSLEDALSEGVFRGSASLEQALGLAHNGVDAFVCPSGTLARSLREHLVQAGVGVPDRVSVTGFHTTPPKDPEVIALTSTESNSAELGVAALRRLVHRIEGEDAGRRVILQPCTLRVGDTTRPVVKDL